jgi:hypothetical protein
MGLLEEIEDFEPHHHSDEEKSQFGDMQPDVFVSILDPLKDPPFVPSPTKALPLWIDLLPNSVFREKILRSRTRSECKHNRRASGQYARERSDTDHTVRKPSWHGAGIQVMPTHLLELSSGDTTPRKISLSESFAPASRRQSGYDEAGTGRKSSLPGSLPIIPPPQGSLAGRGRRTTIAFNPHIKKEQYSEDFNNIPATYKRYRQIEPAHSPIKESTAPPPRERTPWPTRVPDPTIKTTDYFNPNSKTTTAPNAPSEWRSRVLDMQERTCAGPSSSRQPEVACPTPLGPKAPLLSKSSEYIERYKPQSPAPKIDKYVAKPPQPVLETLGLRRRSVLGVDDGITSKIPGVTTRKRPRAGTDDDEEKVEKGEKDDKDGKGKGRVGIGKDPLQNELERVFRARQFGR